MSANHETEFNRLVSIPGLADDIYLQYLLMVNLSEIWPSLSELKQAKMMGLATQLVQRCREAADPDITFKQLLALSEDDLYDALRFDLAKANDYPLDPGEDIYPEASPTSTNWLARYLWWARQGNAPLAFHVWSALSVLSTVAQRRVFFPGGRRIWMNMYLMLGGVSSSGKGQAYEPAVHMMNLVNQLVEKQDWDPLDKQHRKLNILAGDITAEAVVTELKARTRATPQSSVEHDEETNEVTVSFDFDKQLTDATGVIPLDEAGTFFGRDAWGAARKGVFLTTIKESENYSKSTKKDGFEELANLAIGMIACCAPAWMQTVIDRTMLGGGLMDRMIWVYREPSWARRRKHSIRTSPPKDPLVARGLAQWLIDKILMQPIKIPAQMTPEAEELIDGFYLELVDKEESEYKVLGGDTNAISANRSTWATLQVATLLAMAEGNFPPLIVTEGHVATAIHWVKAEASSMNDFMGEANKSKGELLEKRMMDFIERSDGCVRKSSFNQEFREYGLSQELLIHVKGLADRDLLEIQPVNSPRKMVIYRLAGHSCEQCKE